MGDEEYVPEAVCGCGPDCDRHRPESFADPVGLALERDNSMVLYAPHVIVWSVFYGRQRFWERSDTDLVAAGWSGEVQGLVGPLQIVDITPGAEPALAIIEV
tara:strand:- start:320 stop:625 length:306 start_codon:yes stop_codon:yes gene_type:complete